MKVSYDTLPAAVNELLKMVERIEKQVILLTKESEEAKIRRGTPGENIEYKPDEMLSTDVASKIDVKSQEESIEESKEKDTDYITIREAVLLLKIKPSKIYYHLKRNKVSVVYKGNKLYYSKKELIAAIEMATI